ncbi:LysE family translocator [Flavobacteriales bacterium]|nr:LysE family translocator [Flavobacteriales bacterium]
MSILTGLFLGLTTLLFIGPVFFYLLKTSIEYGVKPGVSVAFGIIIGDIICVLLAIFGFGSFFEQPEVQKAFAGIGGLLLLFYGLKYIIKPTVSFSKNDKIKAESLVKYFLNGFLINFVNPFVFAVWFGFYTLSSSKYTNESVVIICLVTALVAIFVTDILKVIFANKLSYFINPANLKLAFKIFGVIMIVFSLRLFLEFFNI